MEIAAISGESNGKVHGKRNGTWKLELYAVVL